VAEHDEGTERTVEEPQPIPPEPVRLLRACCVSLAIETTDGWRLAAVFRRALERIANPRVKEAPEDSARRALEAERTFSWGGAYRSGSVLYWADEGRRKRQPWGPPAGPPEGVRG
jgi:hypothetical protein